jgi:hypothetical protein
LERIQAPRSGGVVAGDTSAFVPDGLSRRSVSGLLRLPDCTNTGSLVTTPTLLLLCLQPAPIWLTTELGCGRLAFHGRLSGDPAVSARPAATAGRVPKHKYSAALSGLVRCLRERSSRNCDLVTAGRRSIRQRRRPDDLCCVALGKQKPRAVRAARPCSFRTGARAGTESGVARRIEDRTAAAVPADARATALLHDLLELCPTVGRLLGSRASLVPNCRPWSF